MPAGIFSLVVAFVSGITHSQEWTTWTRCTGSYCLQSRILQCTLDSNQAVGFDCAKVGEAYFEMLGNECTSECEEWSQAAGNSLCIGNCYNSKMEFKYICATQSQCLKRQMRRCYNHSTCLGRWTAVSISSCSATCGVGIMTVHKECKIGHSYTYTSYNCPGSEETSSSRQQTQSCYNCNDWEFWSDWTECNVNCTRSRKRSCNADVSIGYCKDYSIVQNDVQNCSSCITNTLPMTGSSEPSQAYLYLAIGVGGAVLLLLISVASIVIVRRGKEKKTSDEKRERVRITDITSRYSPTDGCSRVRHSFGSHYENLDRNLYSTPGDTHKPSKQSLTTTASKTTEDIKTAEYQKSTALRDLNAPEYSMAADVQLPTGGFSATDSESFDEDASNDDVVEPPEVNDAVYATISEVKPVKDKKISDQIYAKVKMKKKKERKSKKKSENEKSFNVADQQEPSPYYESLFKNRGFVAEDTPSYSEILERSNTIRAPQHSKDAIMPRWMSTRVTGEAKKVRSRTEIRRSPIEFQRGRSTTTPALPLQSVEYSLAAPEYTDMSGAVDVLKSVEYTDMTMKDGKFVTKTSHKNVQNNFESYTDMSSKRIEIPDAYSMDPVSQ